MRPDYDNKISRVKALQMACHYLQARLYNGSRPKIIFEHAVHVFNVAKIAENIAKHSGGRLNPDTAYSLGLLHDIGRIKDETVTKVPHGVEGFNYLMENGYPDLAPICLTHSFINKDIKQSDYPTYSGKLFTQVKDYLNDLEYTDYDRIIQLADLYSRGKEILSIHERLEKNKKLYKIENLSYEQHAYELQSYIDNKYNINSEKLVRDMFKKPTEGRLSMLEPMKITAQMFSFYKFEGKFA